MPGSAGDPTTRRILEKEPFALDTSICEITEGTIPYGPIEIDELQQKLMDGEYPYVDDSTLSSMLSRSYGILSIVLHKRLWKLQGQLLSIRKAEFKCNAGK